MRRHLRHSRAAVGRCGTNGSAISLPKSYSSLVSVFPRDCTGRWGARASSVWTAKIVPAIFDGHVACYVQNGCGQACCCRPRASRARHLGFTRGGCLRDATDHCGAGDKRVYPHDRGPCRQADSRLKTGYRMTGNPDRSLTIDTHHHILPDFFWRETTRLHSLIQSLRKDSKP